MAEETSGPFPADGSNTNAGVVANVLDDRGVIRADIAADIDGTHVQTGIPLTLTMTFRNINDNCKALSGHYVYIWPCNRTGNYSQYSGAMNGGNFAANTFLRGVQQTDANGPVTFTSIFPGRCQGRATHIHFEVYPDASFQVSEKIATSQLAFPASVTDEAYTADGNGSSAANDTRNEDDNVFEDGTSTEMLRVSGDNDAGYVAAITVTVSA